MKPKIVACHFPEEWAPMAAGVIGSSVSVVISRCGVCNVMLTGGNTAERLYNYWSDTSVLPLKQMRFLFGDERCVSPRHVDSNYALAMRTLFAKGVPPGCSVIRIEAENSDRDAAARKYEEFLPKEIDVLLLGMGGDGHIASLFPYSAALRSTDRTVLPVAVPNLPHDRLTITPQVIVNAGSVFLLATGEEKGRVLAEALRSPEDFMSLPVRLTLGGTWLLDDPAARQVRQALIL